MGFSSENQESYLNKFRQNERLAEIYYAYHSLHRYLEEPFTSFLPEALFNISRFVLSETVAGKPSGVSQLYPFNSEIKQVEKVVD